MANAQALSARHIFQAHMKHSLVWERLGQELLDHRLLPEVQVHENIAQAGNPFHVRQEMPHERRSSQGGVFIVVHPDEFPGGEFPVHVMGNAGQVHFPQHP